MNGMKTSEWDFDYPQPLYTGGKYRISLLRAVIWYEQKIPKKGDRVTQSQVVEFLPELVKGILGDVCDRDRVLECIGLDWVIDERAEYIMREMTNLITGELLRYFPKLGAFIPEHYYYVDGKDLYFHVPIEYEEQRGVFF